MHTRPFVKRDGINWISMTVFASFHVGAIAALFVFSWPAFLVALALYWISLSLGIGLGYHRLLTHRSFKSPKRLEYLCSDLRNISVAEWSGVLGGGSPHPSPVL
jgi:fatty-acid desaturase